MLNEINLSRIDLNLFVLFEAVLAERHVTRSYGCFAAAILLFRKSAASRFRAAAALAVRFSASILGVYAAAETNA